MARTDKRTDLQHASRRRQVILERLRAEGQVRAIEVAGELGVTHETVRKDLVHLEKRGLLRRVHGGALPADTPSFEANVVARTAQTAEKERIAAAAVRFIPSEGAVLFDAGSTVAALVEAIPPATSLTAITNTLPIALSLLAFPHLEVHTVGGRVRPTTMAEVDHRALRALGELRVDVAFIGTNGISLTHGLSTPNDSEAAAKRAMVAAAQRTVLLADHTKFDQVAVFQFAEAADIDVLITDREAPGDAVRELRERGVDVVLA